MKKVYRLENLDCANCAAKMERKIQKIKGVEDASVSFMTQRLSITAEESAFDGIIAEAQKAISKVEPDCKIVIK